LYYFCYRLAKKYLSQSTFTRISRIKNRVFGVSWVVPEHVSSKQAEEGLLEILNQFDLSSVDTILVHSSAAQLARVGLKSSSVIKILEELILPEGTILMPSFPFGQSFYEFIENNPVFKVNRTPSRMGMVTEVFRRSPGVLRSQHPTHPVCAKGKDAQWYVSEHHLDETPFGPHSPFAKLADRGGIVIGLGLQPDFCLTNVHVIEDQLGDDFPIKIYSNQKYQVEIIDHKDQATDVEVPIHDEKTSKVRDVSILIDALKERRKITLTNYQSLACFKISGRDINEVQLELLGQGTTIYRTD
jgi:aminoglycoside 3-N-acetyltransferase